MNLAWSDEDLAFRDEVRAFLADNLTDELREAGSLMTSVYATPSVSRQWVKLLNAKGWAAPSWPREYGGCDWSVVQKYIYHRERRAAGAPPVSPMGIQMCGPALIAFGSEAQKAHFLPRMLNGEHFWCQGYSEPDAGSDLASLQMSAVEDGEHLICNGTKVWTTHADGADWMFCLVRTSRQERPQRGITFLLIDMKTPGIEVRPIIMLSGEHIQNSVHFTDVRAPKANIVGRMDEGWSVAKNLLAFERSGTSHAADMAVRLDMLESFARNTPGDSCDRLIDDPGFAAKIAAARIRGLALEMHEMRIMADLSSGRAPGPSASVMKVLGTELSQHMTELFVEAAAHYSIPFQPGATRPGGAVALPHSPDLRLGAALAAIAPLRYFNDRAGTIYAGTSEIQRNIIAKTMLGL